MKSVSVANIQNTDFASNQQSNLQNQAITKLASGPLSNGTILPSVSLSAGSNNVSHKLGSKLQGWIVVRQRASATIFDEQDSNTTPDQTLKLNASGAVVVDLFVF